LIPVATPGSNEDIVSVAVFGNMVAWCRNLNFRTAEVQGSLIEWRGLQK
jgi:hypothetical protein